MTGSDLLLLALGVAAGIQCISVLGSFVMMLVAIARRDLRHAGLEALVFVGMVLTVPLAAWGLVASIPECRAHVEGRR